MKLIFLIYLVLTQFIFLINLHLKNRSLELCSIGCQIEQANEFISGGSNCSVFRFDISNGECQVGTLSSCASTGEAGKKASVVFGLNKREFEIQNGEFFR